MRLRTGCAVLVAAMAVPGQETVGTLRVGGDAREVYEMQPLRLPVILELDPEVEPGFEVDATTRRRRWALRFDVPWWLGAGGLTPLPGGTRRDVPTVVNDTTVMARLDPRVERDGRAWRRITVARTLVPTEPGERVLEPATAELVVRTGGGRGIFNERLPAREERHRLRTDPVRITVLPLPEEGRPPSFRRAVGVFELRTGVDRERVRVGETVRLTLTITGEGNLGWLEAPAAPDHRGLYPLEVLEVRQDAGAVVFAYDLRVLTDDVEQVPGVTWSWFDPRAGRYVERTTRPIPIDVRPGATAGLTPLPADDGGGEDEAAAGLRGLKSVEGPPRLRHEVGMATRWLAVLLPWLVAALLAGIGWMRRHRGSRGRARGAVRELRARLAAGDDPGAALVAYLAARLGVAGAAVHGPDLAVRLRRSGVDPGLAGAVAEAVEAHDAGRYGGGGTVDRVRVEELVRRLEAVAWRGVGAVGSCLAAVLIAGAAPAQDARAGVAACHDGDHAAAVRHFRAAVDAVPDGRVLYDLGHALYRLDRLAEARWAYECALLRLPRDPDVRANLALVRRRLGADDVGGSSFSDSLDALRRLATDGERLVLCAVLQALAAALLLAGVGTTRRRIGAVLLAPALLMAVETLWWAPHRPPRAVLVGPAQVVSEPRVGMEPLGRAPAGAVARHLGGSEDWARIRLGDCTGFVPAKVLRVVE